MSRVLRSGRVAEPATTGAKRKREAAPPAPEPSPEAPMEAAATQLSDELTCAVCFSMLCAPHVLPCGHTFCGNCLWKHAHNSANLAALSCPTCRAPLPPAPPALQLQLSSYLCRARAWLATETVGGETSEEWEVRRRQ